MDVCIQKKFQEMKMSNPSLYFFITHFIFKCTEM